MLIPAQEETEDEKQVIFGDQAGLTSGVPCFFATGRRVMCVYLCKIDSRYSFEQVEVCNSVGLSVHNAATTR